MVFEFWFGEWRFIGNVKDIWWADSGYAGLLGYTGTTILVCPD